MRKVLAIGPAVLAVSVMTLGSGVVHAVTPHGPIAGVEVNGNRAAGSVAIDGIFKSGTFTRAGFTAGCIGGTVGGTVDRGPDTTPQFRITSLNVVCDSPLGDDQVTTLVNSANCNILVNMADNLVHDTNAVDSGAVKTNDIADVTGSATIPNVAAPTGPCLRVSVLGSCTFHVLGSLSVNFDEAIKTVGGVNYQDVVLKGNALTTQSPSFGCLGLVTNGGAITLNDIRFNVKVSTGTIARGINFY